MIVRVRPDRVPDACPETLVTVIVPVARVVVVVVVVTVTGPVAWLVARLVRVVAVLAAHDPSMTRKTRCSISTSASRTRLPIARNCGAGG
jgi:hypothetical protein